MLAWPDVNGGKTGLETVTYSFEIPVYHTAGVEIAEALSDTTKLAMVLRVG